LQACSLLLPLPGRFPSQAIQANRRRSARLLMVVGGHRPATMLGYRRSLLPVVWIVVGIVVAAIYDYFDSLETVSRVLTAAAAVVLWPILLFGFEIRISR
jgi:hypothetical protein